VARELFLNRGAETRTKKGSLSNLDRVFCPRKQCSPKKGLRRISTALFGSENSSEEEWGTGRPEEAKIFSGGRVPPISRAYA